MKTRRFPVIALALALAVSAPPLALAQAPAARDTSLGGFLEQLSDSTDAYFGSTATPVDTAGLDTVLADTATLPRRRLELKAGPSCDFSRVDGWTPGLSVSLAVKESELERTGWGKLQGRIARANGPHTTLGGARYTNRLSPARQPFDLSLWAGRKTAHLDGDEDESLLVLARALLLGSDWTQYYRADGFEGSIAHARGWWRASAGYRDLLQSPLRTTTTWTLFGRDLETTANLAATRGRNRELEYAAAAHWPRTPLHTEVDYRTSSRRLGSDFEYRRVRAAAALDLSLGRLASLLPQFSYGHLTGDLPPQASFYLGGRSTLRSLHRDEGGGSGLALAKLDLIAAPDLLALLRIPHPAALPLQGAVFAASGTLWGRDPFTGAVRPGDDWPERRDWTSEAGASLLYNSSLFSRRSSLRVSHAWPVGPGSHEGRWTVSFSRPLDLLSAEPENTE
jgi:hypothetical protein